MASGGKGVRLAERLRGPQEALEAAYRRLAGGAPGADRPAAEWLLDNYYIVERAFQLVREEFPPAFDRRLPRNATGPLRGFPVSYALAQEIVTAGAQHVEVDTIVRLVEEFQTVRTLSVAEVWALPALLRIVLLESLASAVSIALSEERAVAACIRSLHTLETTDWRAFFERVSETERILREDPAGAYARMDFETRDRYRKVVEELAARGDWSEEAVAREAVERSRKGRDGRRGHVGYHLIDGGFEALGHAVGYRPRWGARWRRFLLRHPTPWYLGAIAVVAVVHLVALGTALFVAGAAPAMVVAAVVLALVPAVTIAVSLVNRLVTRVVPVRVLPKMDFREGLPVACRTMIVVHGVLSPEDDISPLLSRLEVHQLASADANLHLALLVTLADAPAESMPGDIDLLRRLEDGIRRLNAKYGHDADGPLHLLHRRRLWNAGEGCWMAWERKRGQLTEFNRLLAGDRETSFVGHVGDARFLLTTRFVITLDADTELPRGAAHRLVATFAHPLNRAEIEAGTGRVTCGYTILQPRMEVTPSGAAAASFSRFFAGDPGLDLYARASSDVYQDLFGEGVYVGKGIYDPVAFEASLRGRVPENAILSHDLFEGIHGRTALVTDVVLFESYPADYRSYWRRLHRWVRGDWQLLPWLRRHVPLAAGGRAPNRLSLISRWKIIDNLRRTVLPPTLLGFLLLAWVAFPGSPAVWTVIAVLVLAAPLLTEAMGGLISATGMAARLRPASVLWILDIALLPHRAVVLADAILRTLVRLRRGRHLLEWTSAAQVARRLVGTESRRPFWREMVAAPTIAIGTLALLAVSRPTALPAALPLATLWLLAPEIAAAVSRPRRLRARALAEGDVRRLRLLARRTWLFFDRFVGPDDHWLPPDHFQEEPRGEVARRTSPTNIGLLQLATLSAHDLGHVGLLSVILRLRNTFETLARMERHRGHFYNWYDTRDLSPLSPRYVSTVDSGNLAACLLVVKQACRELVEAPVIGPARWGGLIDTLDVLSQVIERRVRREHAGRFTALRACVEKTRAEAIEVRAERRAWGPGIASLLERGGTELDQAVLAAIAQDVASLDPDLLSELRVWSAEVPQHLEAMWRDIELCLPWEAPDARPPVVGPGDVREALAETWAALERRLAVDPTLNELTSTCAIAGAALSRLEKRLAGLPDDAAGLAEARVWAERLQKAIARARETARIMLSTLDALAEQAEALFDAMDFTFLYDEGRRLFYIGHDVTADRRDAHHYDLLASEARLASFIAIAKGDVPEEHWLQLGRPLARVDGATTLLSWNGTMFEYLMPALLLREAPDSLIGRACASAVRTQIAYADRHEVPWGMSESGYHRFDAQHNYQYRAFGVPDLGFKRGLEDDVVVAPYASLLALPFAPRAVMANLDRLDALGVLGPYGLYEAVDFTASRLEPGATHAIVRSFMAHHQGMILTSINNVIHDARMVHRFHADAIVRTTETLLFERPAHTGAKGRRHVEPAAPRPAPRRRAPLAPWPARSGPGIPQAHVLSNGRYRVLVSDGGGGSDWGVVTLTRRQADRTLDGPGFRLYLRDLDRRLSWSVTPGDGELVFHAHMVERRQRVHDIALHEQVCVAPDDDVEVRLVTLRNHTASRRRLVVTSYAEVVIGDAGEDQRHPAFSKLFVESEYVDDLHALVFHRRPRSARKPDAWLAHLLVLPSARARAAGYESSRERFVGRGRTVRQPGACDRDEPTRAGMAGATLDPIMALAAEIELPAYHAATIGYVVLAADSREDVLALARRYRSLPTLEWSFELARQRSETEVADLGLSSQDLPAAAMLLSLLLYPHDALRAPAAVLAENHLGQRSLWKHAVSGDLPILLVRIGSVEDTAILPSVLRAHRFWRGRGVSADVVILNERAEGYLTETGDHIDRAITQAGADAWRDQPGGVFIVPSARIAEADRILLLSAARVVLDGARGDIGRQLGRVGGEPARLPRLVPSLVRPPAPESLPRPDTLVFDNGLGGFSADGREYVIHLEPGASTPAPWVNVVANRHLGFVVSESGGGYTWAENSGENRLTPWRNDPTADEPGEVVYLRDEETGVVWTPTPRPAPADGCYQIRYGAGYATFLHRSHGLEQTLRLWVPPDDPLKLVELTLTNRFDRPRRLTVTYYVEWVLGAMRDRSQAFVVPEFDPASEALLAQNPWNEDFAGRVAFVAASGKLHGLTADRTEFLGRHGSYAAPGAMERIGLESAVRAGLDPCAVLQLHLDLAPGATARVHFMLGQAAGRDEALGLVTKYRERATVEAAWADLQRHWDTVLGTVTVRTPDPALDLMLNRWFLYQVLSSRIWGRTGYYQSSGAFGFRDQLQDVAALIHAAPTMCRDHILEAAGHQFEEGDVLHWWHPPAGAGVRTRCSDDLLWLPFITAHYVEATGDDTILSEEVSFLAGAPLEPNEVERYQHFAPGERRATLYRHCVAALERGLTAGPHGLPLFGSGDWNDGMDRVGIGGRGESVWLGWFLHATLSRFACVSERIGDLERARTLQRQAEELRGALEASAWDGAWYRRGYYDDGTPLGSAERAECRIDSLAQSWAVLSSAADKPRAASAMDAVAEHLVREQEGLILLLTPPFAGPEQDPGYIRGYPPGIRENGGQYTHAALWVLWALAELGDVERAVDLFHRLLPIPHALTGDAVATYRAEPYVIAADVYAAPPWTGRGGWTWYTGAAAWAYRLGLEAILGLRPSRGGWRLDPRIPASWPEFEMIVRDGLTVVHIRVENPRRVNSGVERMLLDGEPVDPPILPRLSDGRTHDLRVTMGSLSPS